MNSQSQFSAKVIAAALLVLLVGVQAVGATSAFKITVKMDLGTYSGTQTVKVTGSVRATNGSGPGQNTAVFVKITNPQNSIVVATTAAPNKTSGAYEADVVTGGSSAWVAGTYKVSVTWGAYPPTITNSTTFSYALAVTTTTTTTTTSTTSSSSSTTSTTSSSTTTSSSSTSSVPPTTSTTSSSSTSTSSSSSSSSSGGGIPEFPIETPLIALAFSVLIAALYFYVRQDARKQLA
ncbi:MAG: hypothetical protein OK438_03100 [Thaumarchaeota archaeon]|nr:hypothetical protein [Nitrososphaerota archaeon]